MKTARRSAAGFFAGVNACARFLTQLSPDEVEGVAHTVIERIVMWATMAIRIRRARLGASLTQAQLARHTGVNRSAVAQWERAEGATTPSVANLANIAVATKVAFEWLATWTP